MLRFESAHAISPKEIEDNYDVETCCSVVMSLSSRDGSGSWMFPALECFQILLVSFNEDSEGPRSVLRHLKGIILSRLEATDCTSIRSLTVKARGINPDLFDFATLHLLVPEIVVIV